MKGLRNDFFRCRQKYSRAAATTNTMDVTTIKYLIKGEKLPKNHLNYKLNG
jgi:hypothetical protein